MEKDAKICVQPVSAEMPAENISPKSRLMAVLLCWFLGSLGIHRFYLGKTTSGVMQILFGWATLFIWNFVDLIMLLCGTFCAVRGGA